MFIVENFGILAYFLAFQVLIAYNFGTFCRKMKVNLTRIWTQYLLQSAQDSTALPELWNFEVLNIKQQKASYLEEGETQFFVTIYWLATILQIWNIEEKY